MSRRSENELRFAEHVVQTRRKMAVKAGLFFLLLALGIILDASVDGRMSLGFVLKTLSLLVGIGIVLFTVAGVGLVILSPVREILARIVSRQSGRNP